MTFRRGGQTQHSGYQPLYKTNVQKDNAYYAGDMSQSVKEVYLAAVNAQKDEAKKALTIKQDINAADLDKTGWWSLDHDDHDFPIITYEQLWDYNNATSVNARWFWDTQRYTVEEARPYYQFYQQYLYLRDNTNLLDEYNKIPINTTDKMYKDGTLTPLQRQIWDDRWNAAGKEALREINDKQWVTRTELDTTKWSTEPNDSDFSQASWDNVAARAFWDTGRFTFQQAVIYLALSNDAQKNPVTPSVDCIHFIKDIDWISPSSIVEGVSNFALCEVGKLEDAIVTVKDDIIQTVKDLINPYMTTLEIIIFLLLSGGVVAGLIAYKSGALGFAARTGVAATKFAAEGAVVLAGGGPILGGVQYLGNKMIEAKQNNTTVSKVIASDLSLAAVNPTGFAAKVIGEQLNK